MNNAAGICTIARTPRSKVRCRHYSWALSHCPCQSGRRPWRAGASSGDSGRSTFVVGLFNLGFGDVADFCLALRRGPSPISVRTRRDSWLCLHTRELWLRSRCSSSGGWGYLLGAAFFSYRQPRVWRIHRGLQLVSARHCASRRARRGFVQRMGHRISRRRVAAGFESGAVFESQVLGLSNLAVRINLSSAGVWWALFSVIPLAALRNRAPGRNRGPERRQVEAFREFADTLRKCAIIQRRSASWWRI